MKRKLLALMLLLTIMTLLFSACNETEQKKPSNSKPKTTENKQHAKEENNSEKTLKVLKNASESSGFGISNSGYGFFMTKIDFDDSVKNPYNDSTDIHVLNRTPGILDEQDNDYSDYSASIAVIDMSTAFLKNYDNDEVTYGCNPNNKGVVMGFVYQDGFYIYQIDENGNKQNEITYIFPGYEYPEWADKVKQ
jgi:hypothetical protein